MVSEVALEQLRLNVGHLARSTNEKVEIASSAEAQSYAISLAFAIGIAMMRKRMIILALIAPNSSFVQTLEESDKDLSGDGLKTYSVIETKY